MESVWVEGLEIAYQRVGSGPPLVLLHGGLSDSRTWRRQLDTLSDAFTVVAWDAPGCGRSSDPLEDFSMADYTACLAGLVDALSLERPHVVGLSFGGGLTVAFYRDYPHIPRTLVPVSAYAGWAGSLPPETVAERLERGIAQSEQPPEEVVQAWLPTLFEPDTPVDVVQQTAEIMADFHPVGMRAMLRAFAAADLRDVLPTIRAPTLLIYGERDRRSPRDVALALHEAIPESELLLVPDVGHLVHREAPAAFDDAVRSFCLEHG